MKRKLTAILGVVVFWIAAFIVVLGLMAALNRLVV